MTNGGRTASLCACVLLAAACGDDPISGASGSGTDSTGEMSTTTSPATRPTSSSPSADDTSTTDLPTTSPISAGTSSTSTSAALTDTLATTTTDTGDTTSGDTTSGDTTSDSSTSTTSSSSDTATSDTTSDTTTTGGCASANDCPPPMNPCLDATCDAGECGSQPAPLDTPCQGGVCDGDGTCNECNQISDCPAPAQCHVATCTLGVCGTQSLPHDAPCDAGVCDDEGNCHECNGSADCPPPPGACVMAACISSACGSQPVDPGTPCPAGVCDGDGACVACNVDADCPAQQLCQNHQCVPPPASCMDNQKNGSETDVDCGGSTCPPCPVGDTCLVGTDCVSATCQAGVCVPPQLQCATAAPDPATGQRCPLFMPCTQNSECGVFQGCQQWFCNPSKTCELNALSSCWTDVGGSCNADVVFTQQTLPPVAKRFLPPDGVTFREVASLVFTVRNNTATDLWLDKLPLELDVQGGGSKFDVSSVKIFDNSGGAEHGVGDILVCLTANPFSFPANGVMGPCAGSSFARVPKNSGTNQFVVNVAFTADKTNINGRSYRLRVPGTGGIQFKSGSSNGPLFAGTTCGIPSGYTGAWVTAQTP